MFQQHAVGNVHPNRSIASSTMTRIHGKLKSREINTPATFNASKTQQRKRRRQSSGCEGSGQTVAKARGKKKEGGCAVSHLTPVSLASLQRIKKGKKAKDLVVHNMPFFVFWLKSLYAPCPKMMILLSPCESPPP